MLPEEDEEDDEEVEEDEDEDEEEEAWAQGRRRVHNRSPHVFNMSDQSEPRKKRRRKRTTRKKKWQATNRLGLRA